VARSRVALVVFVIACVGASTADAQTPYTGMLTGHLGPVAGGDVRDWTIAPGGSMAVVENGGLGAELDISHNGDFDGESFADSSITPITLNFVAMYMHDRIRPFLVVGVGVMRVHAASASGQSSTSTEPAWDTGAGVLYMLNDAIGVRGDVRYFRHFNRQDMPFGDNGVLDFVRTSVGVTYSWPLK
jgi:opacity protein-like surface antigen